MDVTVSLFRCGKDRKAEVTNAGEVTVTCDDGGDLRIDCPSDRAEEIARAINGDKREPK